MNAFTDNRRLINIRTYLKSDAGRKGGAIRAKALGGAAVVWLKGSKEPEKREINYGRDGRKEKP